MDLTLFIQETKYYIDKKLHEHIMIHDAQLSTLYASIHYTLHAGGKRIRPIFCFAVGEMWLFAMFEARPKSCRSRPLYASAGCVHFVDHTPSAESA